MSEIKKRLSLIEPALLRQLGRGLEKESLRSTPEGRLSARAHPRALGSALTHPLITTDFSESQLELITGVHHDLDGCLRELTETHQEVLHQIGDEILWCTSMPCELPADAQIPIGQYGSSFIGRAKTIYRIGLKHRYGSRMQTISGLHYNFSIPAALWPVVGRMPGLGLDDADPRATRDRGYFALIRNFREQSWLLMLLFGASPMVLRSFAEGLAHGLQPVGSDALGLPHATSLRMGPLGYQSDAQAQIGASHNCLGSYARSLHQALTRPYPPYEKIGIRQGNDYLQLSTSLLQIENEFYGTIRPKQRIHTGERPLSALSARGVEYVEVRLMDLDPFEPIGISAPTIRFLDTFLLYCLLSDSPPDSPAIIAAQSANRHSVAQRGREPGLTLESAEGTRLPLVDWARRMLDACLPVAQRLDEAWPEHQGAYQQALATMRTRLDQPDTTPSGRLMSALARRADASLGNLVCEMSTAHRQQLLALPHPLSVRADFEKMASDSFSEQARIEAADTGSFEAWRQHYISSIPPLDQ